MRGIAKVYVGELVEAGETCQVSNVVSDAR